MTVVMMPMFLYQAPCGLTLYMVTSSCIGILESRYIRKHITELELNPPAKKESRLAKLRDPLARAYAKRLEEAKRGKEEPPKSFKKRK
jgi:YidC/Oxa1 family membrane protein insertase